MTAHSANSSKPRSRRWILLVILVLAMVVLFTALLPTFISSNSGKNWVLKQINQRTPGTLQVDSWSLGWFTPITLKGFSFTNQQVSVKGENFQTQLTLLKALAQNFNIGDTRLQNVSIIYHLDEQDQKAPPASKGGSSSGEAPQKPSEREPGKKGLPGIRGSFSAENVNITILKGREHQVANVQIPNSRVAISGWDKPIDYEFLANLLSSRGSNGEIKTKGNLKIFDRNGNLNLDDINGSTETIIKSLDLGLISRILSDLADSDMKLAGLANLELHANTSSSEFQARGTAMIDDFQANLMDLGSLKSDFQVNRSGDLWKIQQAQLKTRGIDLVLAGTLSDLQTQAHYELDQVNALLKGMGFDFGYGFKGSGTSSVNLQGTWGKTAKVISTHQVRNFELTGLLQNPIQQDQMSMVATADLKFDDKNQPTELILSNASFNSPIAKAVAIGKIGLPSGNRPMQLDVEKKLIYDWNDVRPYLAEFLPPEVVITGKEEQVWKVQGPWAGDTVYEKLRGVKIQGSGGFQSMDCLGLVIGRLQVPVQIEQGTLRIQKTSTSCNEGTLTVAGSCDLNPSALFITLPSNLILLENVRITESLAKNLFSRFYPLFANAVGIEGRVGAIMENTSLPLGELLRTKGTADGVVQFRNFVLRTEGPINQVLSQIVKSSPELTAEKQDLKFHLKNGRIHYDDFALGMERYTVTFRGSVGLDQTLQMEMVFPVTPKMVGGQPEIYNVVKDQVITIPISGTTTSPKVDTKKLQDELGRLLKEGAKSGLGDALKNLLEKNLK